MILAICEQSLTASNVPAVPKEIDADKAYPVNLS